MFSTAIMLTWENFVKSGSLWEGRAGGNKMLREGNATHSGQKWGKHFMQRNRKLES